MKKFLNRWMIALILFCIPISILANSQPFSILGSVVNTGDLAGGLRYTIDSDWVVDGWISSRQDSNSSRVTHYWADIYYRNFGIVLSGTDNTGGGGGGGSPTGGLGGSGIVIIRYVS